MATTYTLPHGLSHRQKMAAALYLLCKPCCGSGSGSGAGIVECVVFNCLLNGAISRAFTITVDNCTLVNPFYSDTTDGSQVTGCDEVCFDDPSHPWFFDAHDVSIQAGCVTGGDNIQIWTGPSPLSPGCASGSLAVGICCINRDDGVSYISLSAVLTVTSTALGSTSSSYAFKTRNFGVSTDGTYTYITASNLQPFQTALGSPECCTTPVLNFSLKLEVDGALCL